MGAAEQVGDSLNDCIEEAEQLSERTGWWEVEGGKREGCTMAVAIDCTRHTMLLCSERTADYPRIHNCQHTAEEPQGQIGMDEMGTEGCGTERQCKDLLVHGRHDSLLGFLVHHAALERDSPDLRLLLGQEELRMKGVEEVAVGSSTHSWLRE